MLWGLVAFVREFWAANLVLVCAVGGLAAVAYLTRDIRMALAAVGVAFLGVMASALFKHGYDAKVREDRAEMARVLLAREKTVAELTADNERRAETDAARIVELQKVIDDTPPNNAPGLDRKGAARIRNIR